MLEYRDRVRLAGGQEESGGQEERSLILLVGRARDGQPDQRQSEHSHVVSVFGVSHLASVHLGHCNTKLLPRSTKMIIINLLDFILMSID